MTTRTARCDAARLTRRRLLISASAAVPAMGLAALAGSRAHGQEKVPKDQVNYQNAPKNDQQCAGCRFFLDGACERVQGEISPNGWCSLWSPKQE